MSEEILRVTAEGEFVWHPDADRLIEEGDFASSPAMPYLLRRLRKMERFESVLRQAREMLNHCNNEGWMLADREPQMYAALAAIDAVLKEAGK